MGRHLWFIDELQAVPSSWSATIAPNFSATARTDTSGNGGARSIWVNNGNLNYIKSPTLDSVSEFWISGGLNGDASTLGGNAPSVSWHNPAGASAGSVLLQSNTQRYVYLYRGATIVASRLEAQPVNVWRRFLIHVYIHGTNGFIKLWIDTAASATPYLEFSGDTLESTYATIEKFGFNNITNSKFDDIVVNTMTISYDANIGGAAVAGEVLTDAVTGATADVTGVKTSAGGVGVLYLENWSGVAFGDNNQITSSGTFDALVNAPTADYVSGMEPNSLEPGNEFVKLVRPNAIGNSAQCDMSGTGTPSSETLTLSGQPDDSDQVLIDAKTYTFQTVLTNVDGNVLIGAAATNTIDNLIAAITLGAGAGTLYATAMTLHPTCTAVVGAGDTMDASSNFNGTVWNGLSCTDPTDVSGNLSWGAATMTGGTGENWEAVDSLPTSATDYVEANAATKRDTYKVDAVSVLPSAAEVGIVTCVAVGTFGFSDLGGITNIQNVLRQGGVDYDSVDYTLPTSVTLNTDTLDTQPDGSGAWDIETLIGTDIEIGFEFTA